MKDPRTWIIWLLLIVIFVGGLVACGLYLWGEIMRSTCSDFTSQDAAQEAFNWGNKNLDGDNDGFACEKLK